MIYFRKKDTRVIYVVMNDDNEFVMTVEYTCYELDNS
jgi:hypothetical protein